MKLKKAWAFSPMMLFASILLLVSILLIVSCQKDSSNKATPTPAKDEDVGQERQAREELNTITWGAATNISTATDVATDGTFLYAYNWNNSTQTVNSVVFTGTSVLSGGITGSNGTSGADITLNTAASQTSATGGTGLSGSYFNILRSSAEYHLGNGTATITLNKLVAGHNYKIQVWSSSNANAQGSRTTLSSTGGNQITLNYYANSGKGQYSVGTFTAASSTQSFTLGPQNAGDYDYKRINALQLRDVGGGGGGTAPVITSSTTASGTVGSAFSYQITATNSPTSFNATGLPAGLSVNTSNGLISGTPTTAGTFTVGLSATNASGTGTQNLTLTVGSSGGGGSPITVQAENYSAMSGIQTEACSDAGGGLNVGWINVNDWMDYNVNVPSAGTYTFNFRVASGDQGTLQLRSGANVLASVNISGTGGWQSWTTVSTTATLSAGSQTLRLFCSATGSSGYGYNVNWFSFASGGSGTAPVITSSTTASGTVGSAFSYQITATNSPTSFNATGLPAGLSVNTSNGLISGTPTTANTYNVGLSATNSFGTGTQNLTLTINPSNPGVPAPAASAGYNRLTFVDDFNSVSSIDVNSTGAAGYKWYTDRPFGGSPTLPSAYSVSGGVLTLTNTGNSQGWALSTMSPATGNGGKFRYGYYEARMHFDPTKGATSSWFPCFWSLSAYHTRYNNPDHWAELDFFEAYTGGYTAWSKAFFGTVHDWANSSSVHYQNSNNYQPSTQSADFNQWHTFGCLWKPGSITWYFDRVPLMTQTYSASAPPNPLANGTITPTPAGVFSILDTDPWGMTLILGSSPEWPMYVDYVQVWQQ